ncbi:MAG TPA: ORF6N domain-containing protein [bacterium]|nr:ORF6N domain-containing protein [bacterium]
MTAPKDSGYLIPAERIDSAILEIRGERVMLDVDLAEVYGVTTRRLKEQVRRNRERFPEGFMFELTLDEKDELVAKCDRLVALRHSSSRPYAFTEHGTVMLASVLRSKRAVDVSVFVVRAFIRMRRMLADQRQLAIKLAELERKLATHDRNFQVVFATIKQLMLPPAPRKKRIGFITDDDKPGHTGSGSDFVARDRRRRRR